MSRKNFSVVDDETGECVDKVSLSYKLQNQVPIKRLNSLVWTEAFLWVQNKIIVGRNDIKILGYILGNLDDSNSFRRTQKEVAEELEISISTVKRTFKKMQNIYFIYKQINGVYTINPFVFISRKIRAKKKIHKLQNTWDDLCGTPTESIINFHKTLRGEKVHKISSKVLCDDTLNFV